MTAGTAAWSAAWTLVAAAVGIRLWRRSTAFESSARTGYRWIAAAALCLGIGGTVQLAFGGLIGGAPPLRMADLISLAALPALVIGVARVTADGRDPDRGHAEPGRWRRYQEGSILTNVGAGAALDSTLLVVSLFAIGLVVLFGADYTRSGAGPATFALDLIRPLADLAALGLVLMLAPRSPRLTAPVVLALIAVTIADSLAVASRSVGGHPGVAAQVALVAGIALLAVMPAAEHAAPRPGEPAGSRTWGLAGAWSARARMAAPAAAAAAALVIAGFAVFGHLAPTAAVAVTAAIGVILLVLRLAWFARQAGAVKASARASDWVLRTLVDSTSDTVLICDRSGAIEYISHGSNQFGYGQGNLTGTQLADLVHPEDRPAGVRAAMTAFRSAAGTAAFAGRARSADGSWRQVKATLSRYGQPGEPVRLLITCHDDSELVALRRQVSQLTFHDGLTGLPNRTYLEDRVKDLHQIGDRGAAIAAIVISLDGESAVGDLGGQPVENLVLAQAGRRLRAAAPPGAIVARWGAEQFAVFVADFGSAAPAAADWPQVIELSERLSRAISSEPFLASAKQVQVTASVGVAMTSAAEADQVLADAQLAMSKAVEAGGGRIEVFGEQMRAAAKRRSELAAALGEALAARQLSIEYVPVVELATSAVMCVEAVASWRVGGQRVTAGELLSAAEESGLSAKVTAWMLAEATLALASWRGAGFGEYPAGSGAAASPGPRPLPGLALRVSAKQLSVPGFTGSVLAALDDAGLPPQALTLEVDERVLIRAGVSVKAELAALRDRGISLAIDDYGTGYASLSYLRDLAVDAIKIDSSLVAGLGTDPTLTLLTSAIVGIGRDLGIEVIAAGVDRPDQVDLLKAMGCGQGQGPWLTSQLSAGVPSPGGFTAAWAGPAAEPPAGQSGNRTPHQAGDPACSPAS